MLFLAVGLLVPAHALPPVIQRPPVSQHVEEGSFVRFSTSSPPIPPVSYQWYRNGQMIPGATSANYELHNVGPLERSEFQVRLEDEAGNAATWSQSVELEVSPQIFRPGMIDTSFSVGSVNGNAVKVIVPAANGDLYLGGTFDQISGHPRTNFGRVHSDGSIDTTFNASFTIPGPDTNPEVRAIAIDDQDRIIVGGLFTHCNGQARQNIARLLPDGSLDPTFNPGANDQINTCVFDQSNRLIIGGAFNNFDGAPASRLIRLKVDGSLDTEFINRQAFDASVEEVIRDGTQFYVAGGFTERIIRINSTGVPDVSFDSYRPRSSVTDIALLPDGSLIASGRFSGGLIKISSSGLLDDSFSPRPNDFVEDLTTTADGKIIAAGDFTRIAGLSTRSVARLSSNGDLDESFQPPSLDGPVEALQLVDGKLFIGGDFERPHNNVMRILNSPPVPPPATPAIVSQPRSREVWPGSRITLGVGLTEAFGISYQWYHDNNPIQNANSSLLQFSNFDSEQIGSYHVVVSRGGFSSSSQAATLTLAPATGLASRAQYETSDINLDRSGITKTSLSVPATFLLAQVRPHLQITHPKINDLTIILESPDGTKVDLFDRNGRRGQDIKTTFDSFAPDDLDDGAAPWQGTWKPDQNLNAFFNRSSAGTWNLEIRDPSGSINGGNLDLFRLELIARDPDVGFTNWLNTTPILDQLHVDQDKLYFTHFRWRNSPGLTYEYQSLQGSSWVPFSPTLMYHENLGNNRDALRWRIPNLSYSKIIRVQVHNE